MFKKFVFIPPLIIALLFAGAMIIAAIQGITTKAPDTVEIEARMTDTWSHIPDPEMKLALSYPVFSGTYEGHAFECRCQPNACDVTFPDEIDARARRILLDREDTTRCYDAARGVPGLNWQGSLTLAALAMLLAGACVRALRHKGARSH